MTVGSIKNFGWEESYLAIGSQPNLSFMPPIKKVEEKEIEDLYNWEEVPIKEDYANYLGTDAEQEEFRQEQINLIDKIEEKTLQFFIDFQTIADGKQRESIEDIFGKDKEEAELEEENQQDLQERHVDHIRPFRRDIRIFESEDEQPIHTKNVLNNIVAIAKHVFLGIESLDANHLSLDETVYLYHQASCLWETTLKQAYLEDFIKRVDNVFNNAEELLADRQSYRFYATCERYMLYGFTSVALIGKVTEKHYCKIIGLIGAVVGTLSMLIHYGSHSFYQKRLAVGLMRLADEACTMSGPKRKG